MRKGEPVARVADLSAYRVEGTVSDLTPRDDRRPARAVPRASRSSRARSRRSTPTIRNGVLTFSVSLADKSHAALRPNLRVDVDVLTERQARALRVERRPFASGEGAQNVFVLHGAPPRGAAFAWGPRARALRGARGPARGRGMIVSDMTDYLHAARLRVR